MQLALAERADAKIRASNKYPVLPDTQCLRGYWLPGAMTERIVHERFVPLLHFMLPGLHEQVLWHVLRLAGHVRDD
eukprot:8341127-Karenia_brevis.AAC.1